MALIKDLDDRQMPLLDHLIELRNRLMYPAPRSSLASWRYFFADHIYTSWSSPWPTSTRADRPADDLHRTGRGVLHLPQGRVLGGAFLTFPFVATQLWLFIAPGLYRNEKQAFLPFLVGDPILFFIGRRDGLLRDLPARLAVLPQLRDRGRRRRRCRSSWRRGSASTCRW